MNNLPSEIIQHIGKYVVDISTYKILNKELYILSKREHLKRISNSAISSCLITKKKIINDNDIYNNYQKLTSGIYKILTTNSHNHLFIRLDTFITYIKDETEELYFMFEPAMLYIDGILTPGKISFERFMSMFA